MIILCHIPKERILKYIFKKNDTGSYMSVWYAFMDGSVWLTGLCLGALPHTHTHTHEIRVKLILSLIGKHPTFGTHSFDKIESQISMFNICWKHFCHRLSSDYLIAIFAKNFLSSILNLYSILIILHEHTSLSMYTGWGAMICTLLDSNFWEYSKSYENKNYII